MGAALIAVWFLFGFGGQENRRWFLPVLAAGLIPLAIACAVNYAKFGVLFGVSNFDQVWTHINAYRRKFLAANHNAEEGTIFVPTNVVTYFRPDGLGLSRVFPFISLPSSPPTALNGVLFDRLYRTASLPASTPLLFLLSIWGLVTAFRPKAIGKVARTRLLLLASGSAGAALLLWGYIAPRYLGDFVPFLVLASAVAFADIFRRLETRTRRIRVGSLFIIGVVALFSITANVGMAIAPNEEWDTTQVVNYVQAQKAVSDLTGHPLESEVVRANSLPRWGPAGQLYVIGDCSGLYISNGENYATVPKQQYQRTTWMTVELGDPFQHTFRLSVDSAKLTGPETIPLVQAGAYTLTLTMTPTTAPHEVRSWFGMQSGAGTVRGPYFNVDPASAHAVVVTTDPEKHQFAGTLDGVVHMAVTSRGQQQPIHLANSTTASDALTVKSLATPPTLCRSLIG